MLRSHPLRVCPFRLFLPGLLLALVLVTGPMARAQESWQADPVLSRLLIYELVQDMDGLLWAATDEGAFRYDGYRAVSLNQLLPRGQRLPAGPCRLARGLGDELWLQSAAGLYRYATHRQALQAVPLPVIGSDYSLLKIVTDPASNRLWLSCGAYTLAALYLDRGTPVPGGIWHLPYHINWLAGAPGGRAWVVLDGQRILELGGGLRRQYRGPAGRCCR